MILSLHSRRIGLAVADILRPVRAWVRAIGGAVLAWRRHRQIASLLGTDDHMLADLGIIRSDLLSALAVPLWEDPSVALARRAEQARQGRRSSAGERMRLAARLARG